jgi:serine/threonine protein kinase
MKLIDTKKDDNMIYIICEYIKGCELLKALESISSDEQSIKSWFKKLLLGVRHIHERNIIHRDLKLENIIVKLDDNEDTGER